MTTAPVPARARGRRLPIRTLGQELRRPDVDVGRATLRLAPILTASIPATRRADAVEHA